MMNEELYKKQIAEMQKEIHDLQMRIKQLAEDRHYYEEENKWLKNQMGVYRVYRKPE